MHYDISKILACAFILIIVITIIRVNLWYSRYRKTEEHRRAQLSPGRKQAEYEDWSDLQW